MTLLGVGSILVYTAKALLQNNFSKADRQYSPTGIEYLKRIGIAVLVLLVFPTTAITSYTTSSWLGFKVADGLVEESKLKEDAIYQMVQDNVSFTTKC